LSETDSFVEEVNEELRRDRLYALLRKWGWVPVLLVVIAVGGASYFEWEKATARKNAEAFGDSVLVALDTDDLDQRAEALATIATASDGAATYVALLEAAVRAENSDRDGALVLLDKLAADGAVPVAYRDLALLKSVILRGSDLDRANREAALNQLATPGRPYRFLALEQKALMLFELGNNDDAIAILQSILEEQGVTSGLLQRAQQLIVAMGGVLEEADTGGQ